MTKVDFGKAAGPMMGAYAAQGIREVGREAAEFVAIMLTMGPLEPLDAMIQDGTDDEPDLLDIEDDLDDDDGIDDREPASRPAAEAPAGAESAGRGRCTCGAAECEPGSGQAAEAPADSVSAGRARRGRRGGRGRSAAR